MAAPSSDQTKPSSKASTAPAAQANRHCGPPMALMTSGITTKGPMPTISIMFRATPRIANAEQGCECKPFRFATLLEQLKLIRRGAEKLRPDGFVVQGDRINSYVWTIALCGAAFFCAPVRADKLHVTPEVLAAADQI